MWLFNRRDGVSPPRSPSASPVLGSPHLRTIPSSSSISNQSWQMASKPPASHKARVLLLVVAGVHVFLTAGVVFGWASLADALALAGAFCDDDECSGRASAFAIIFTLGTIGNYTSNLPFGLLLDRYGPNVCCTCGASVQILGTLLMLAPPTVGEWVYYPGFFLLGFGGPGIQISTFHLANLYPTASGSLIAASTALFDAGTAVFFGFSLATASGALTLTSCWLLYLGGCGFVLLTGLLLWPHVPFEAARDESDDESPAAHADALLGDETPSFRDQLASRAFVYLVCFAAAHILRLNFIVGTFQLEVASLGFDAAAVSEYTTGFASALPFGFIGMPLIGFFLDRRPLSDVFLLVNLTGLACIALLLVPHSPLALSAAIGLVAVGRQFVYSTFFAQLQRTAGPNYGKLAGTANLCVAAAGVLQPALVALSTPAHTSPSFVHANLLFAALTTALLTQPLRCWQDVPVARRSATPLSDPPTTAPLQQGAPLETLRVALLSKD